MCNFGKGLHVFQYICVPMYCTCDTYSWCMGNIDAYLYVVSSQIRSIFPPLTWNIGLFHFELSQFLGLCLPFSQSHWAV